MRNLLVAVSIALLGVSAVAQTVGSLAGVTGNVSIVQDGQFVTANNGTSFVNGARIVAGANSSASVQLQNGCTVNLGAGQALIVDDTAPCDVIKARVTNIAAFAESSQAVTGQAGVLGLNNGQLATFAFIAVVIYNSISPR